MQVFRITTLLLWCYCLIAVLCRSRRMHHYGGLDRHALDDEDFVEMLEDVVEALNRKVDDLKDDILELEDEQKDFHGENEEDREKKVGLNLVSKKSINRLSRSEVMRRLKRISSIEDFNREFNIKDDSITKRGSLFSNLVAKVGLAYGNPLPCVPRPSIYSIPHIPANEQYIPGCLNVTRCGGCCKSALTGSTMECVENVTESKVIKVILVDKIRTTYSQKIIPYVNHKTCKCQCKIQAKDCTDQQTYDSTLCICKCKKNANQNCPSNMKWSSTLCGCRCIPPVTKCSPSHLWNDVTCTCDCKPSACAKDEVFNKVLCQCVKTPSNKVVKADD